MARRRRKNRDNEDDPKLLGRLWRSMMREDYENLFSLVWRRVYRVHRIDLADERQASDVQIYRLLRDLADRCSFVDGSPLDYPIDIQAVELETMVDQHVSEVFRL